MKKFSLLSLASLVLLSACAQEPDLIMPEMQNTAPVQALAKNTSSEVSKDKGKLVFSSVKVKKNYGYKKPVLELNLQVNTTLTNSPKEPMIEFMKKFVTTKDVAEYEIFSKMVQGKVESVTLTIYDGDVDFISKTLFVDVYNYVNKTCEIFQSYLIDYSTGTATSSSFYPKR